MGLPTATQLGPLKFFPPLVRAEWEMCIRQRERSRLTYTMALPTSYHEEYRYANIGKDFVRGQTFARKDRHGLLLTWDRERVCRRDG
jgi:hypothetical protein